MWACHFEEARTVQRAGGGNGVWPSADRTNPRCAHSPAYGNRRAMTGQGSLTNGNESHSQKKRRPHEAGVSAALQAAQRPSSNTTSMLTDSVVSPGDTEVSLAKPASAAIARIIGIGRGTLAPPSLMLTMRRTFKPSALA